MAGCVFCKVATHEAPAKVVLETDDTMFFHDIRPKAKVHLVGIVKKHLDSLDTVQEEDRPAVGQLLGEVAQAVRKVGIDPQLGYRVITNIGTHGGQEVPHLHFHILGGELVGPMRC